jgi:hypothetical protein
VTESFPAGELAALAATRRPFRPDECAERARRAADLIGRAGLLPDEAGASYVLWQDEHSVAWPADEASPASPLLLAALDRPAARLSA